MLRRPDINVTQAQGTQVQPGVARATRCHTRPSAVKIECPGVRTRTAPPSAAPVPHGDTDHYEQPAGYWPNQGIHLHIEALAEVPTSSGRGPLLSVVVAAPRRFDQFDRGAGCVVDVQGWLQGTDDRALEVAWCLVLTGAPSWCPFLLLAAGCGRT